MARSATVTSIDQVWENAVAYNAEINSGGALSQQFKQVQHWYLMANPLSPGELLWGPAKFLGYSDMTAKRYYKLNRVSIDANGLHGGIAKQALSSLFEQVDKGFDVRFWNKLSDLLEAWIGKHTPPSLSASGQLRSTYQIHIPQPAFREWRVADEDDASEALNSFMRTAQQVTFEEGKIVERVVTFRSRSDTVRNFCLERHGVTCRACGLNFGDVFGEDFEGLIEVHHINPLSSSSDVRSIDPTKDCVPLCPNCHAMAHFGVPTGTSRPIEELTSTVTKAALGSKSRGK